MRRPALRLPRRIAEQIVAHARARPQEEICGLLSGRGRTCVHCHPVRNVASERHGRFEMDPQGQIAAFRRMRAAGERLVGIYHSHLQQPLVPSARDVYAHAYPEAFCVIVSADPRLEPAVRAYRIERHGAREVPVELI